MAETGGRKRNYEQMSVDECWAEINSRQVTLKEEYYSTKEILQWSGITVDETLAITPVTSPRKSPVKSPTLALPAPPQTESDASSEFYKKTSYYETPEAPYGATWPPGRFSKLSAGKMKDFIEGHLKFFLKGITKQEEVPLEERVEVQEYNTARNLRNFDVNDCKSYIAVRARERVQLDNSLDRFDNLVFVENKF